MCRSYAGITIAEIVGVRYSNVRFNNGTRLGCDDVFAIRPGSIVGLPDVSGAMVQRVAAGWRISSHFSILLFLSTFWGRMKLHVYLWQLLALVSKAGPGDKTVHSCRMRKVETKEGKLVVGVVGEDIFHE